MENNLNRSKLRWSVQPTAIAKLSRFGKEKPRREGKDSCTPVNKEKLLQGASKGRFVISRGSFDSFSSKSGADSDFDLEDSGYLDTHLALASKQAMTAVDLPTSLREKNFRGLNYDVIGDAVCIRGESRQGLLNGTKENTLGDSKVSGSPSNLAYPMEREEMTINVVTTRSQEESQDKLYSLGYLNHRGSFPSNLNQLNGDSFSSVSNGFRQLSVGSSNPRSLRSPLLLQSSRSSSQRDLSTTSSICSDDSVEETLDTETSRLGTVLEHIDPSRLHSHLQRLFKSKNRAVIMALSTLLPRKRFTAETMHCVRCHKEFSPKYGVKTCTLFHPESSVEKMFEDDTGADFACESCGTVFRAEGVFEYSAKVNKTVDCGFCFVGTHTFEADDVEYRPDGIAKTCEDNGCVVFYV